MIFTNEFLEKQLKSALKSSEKSEKDWRSTILANLKSLLKKSPARYRGFGPYWWGLKQAFLNAGDGSFGEGIDLETIELYAVKDDDDNAYDADSLNIIAAVMFEDQETATGRVGHGGESVHIIDDPNTEFETFEYTLIDPDMERRAAATLV